MNQELQPVEVEDVESVGLVVRNINGRGVLFTTDGKMLAGQLPGGHYYYIGEGIDRQTTFRASFLVDAMKPDIP